MKRLISIAAMVGYALGNEGAIHAQVQKQTQKVQSSNSLQIYFGRDRKIPYCMYLLGCKPKPLDDVTKKEQMENRGSLEVLDEYDKNHGDGTKINLYGMIDKTEFVFGSYSHRESLMLWKNGHHFTFV